MDYRIFAIGDIHGHYDELIHLLDVLEREANFTLDKDHLVLLGDLVDSGSKSFDVVDWCMDTSKMFPDTFHPLKGNHDDMMVDWIKFGGVDYQPGWWQREYGQPTIKSYLEYPPALLERHVNYLDELPLFWWPENCGYFFCHAGIPPAPLSEFDEDDPKTKNALLWIREEFYNSNIDFGRKIVFGHSAFEDHTNMDPEVVKFAPYVRGNMIGLNTMPRNFGQLTAVELPLEKFYS